MNSYQGAAAGRRSSPKLQQYVHNSNLRHFMIIIQGMHGSSTLNYSNSTCASSLSFSGSTWLNMQFLLIWRATRCTRCDNGLEIPGTSDMSHMYWDRFSQLVTAAQQHAKPSWCPAQRLPPSPTSGEHDASTLSTSSKRSCTLLRNFSHIKGRFQCP